jgi:hypothetical protein
LKSEIKKKELLTAVGYKRVTYQIDFEIEKNIDYSCGDIVLI